MSNDITYWCSICSKNPADGVARVDDPDNGMLDLHLCGGCVRKMVPQSRWAELGITE